MQNLVPFESAKLPAHIGRRFAVESESEIGSGAGGFPAISIKGKVFTINRGGEKTLVTQPDGDGAPAAALEVVIIAVHPEGRNNCRTFYADGYVEGSEAKPTCQSNDGETPSGETTEPQAKSCMLCPQNAVGSGATNQNPKAKACKSSKMLAVVPVGQLNDPMMIRVPGGSLPALTTFRETLKTKKVPIQEVSTRIGFDYSVAHPALTFKPAGLLSPEMVDAVFETAQSDVVKAITGGRVIAEAGEGEHTPTPAPKLAAPKPTPKAAPAAPKVAPAAQEDGDLPATPRAKVKVEGETAPTTLAAAAAAAPVEVESDADLDAALSTIDFDD